MVLGDFSMDNKFQKFIKFMVILCILEVIVLSFAILSGLENGFKLWNWVIIALGIFVYFLSVVVAIIYDNKGRKKVSKEELVVSDFYKEQAQNILNCLDSYLLQNTKVATDLKLYWPFYKMILKKIAYGKKLNINDYGIIERINQWQRENYDDAFLINVYDVIKNNIL